MRKVEGCLSIIGRKGVAGSIWEGHWGPRGRGSKKNGGLWRLGDRATEAVVKAKSSLGNLLLLLPLCLPWPRVPSESSIAEPLIGAARPGEPKLQAQEGWMRPQW